MTRFVENGFLIIQVNSMHGVYRGGFMLKYGSEKRKRGAWSVGW